MNNNTHKTIVITGCSSGFGRLTALHLARQGWHVFGTVRKDDDKENLTNALEDMYKANLTPIVCDITNAEQVERLAQTVATATPHLDALLNNAGTAFAAPLELLSLEDLTAQFEINVVAQVSVIQALLPQLKSAKGTIINVSSVNGKISTPMVGAYAASKFALEAISDALRVEIAPFGVRVVVIEPGSSPTNIWQTSMKRSLEALESHRVGEYAKLLTTFEKLANALGKRGFPPQHFVDTVERILTSPRPRTRYVVPRQASLDVTLRRFLPDTVFDSILRRSLRW
jgi:NAD(P)-dependent dehydrogenase (short-subunit alcohol dehydrogenase family)